MTKSERTPLCSQATHCSRHWMLPSKTIPSCSNMLLLLTMNNVNPTILTANDAISWNICHKSHSKWWQQRGAEEHFHSAKLSHSPWWGCCVARTTCIRLKTFVELVQNGAFWWESNQCWFFWWHQNSEDDCYIPITAVSKDVLQSDGEANGEHLDPLHAFVDIILTINLVGQICCFTRCRLLHRGASQSCAMTVSQINNTGSHCQQFFHVKFSHCTNMFHCDWITTQMQQISAFNATRHPKLQKKRSQTRLSHWLIHVFHWKHFDSLDRPTWNVTDHWSLLHFLQLPKWWGHIEPSLSSSHFCMCCQQANCQQLFLDASQCPSLL